MKIRVLKLNYELRWLGIWEDGKLKVSSETWSPAEVI